MKPNIFLMLKSLLTHPLQFFLLQGSVFGLWRAFLIKRVQNISLSKYSDIAAIQFRRQIPKPQDQIRKPLPLSPFSKCDQTSKSSLDQSSPLLQVVNKMSTCHFNMILTFSMFRQQAHISVQCMKYPALTAREKVVFCCCCCYCPRQPKT